jgi:hypothetical protein
MCLFSKPLIQSHLASAALYKLCRAPDSDPIQITPEVVMRTGRQLQDYLLCSQCDGMLSTEGENWLLPLVGRLDGFPFYDILTNQKPDAVDGNSALYAAAKNPEIDVPKVIHFAMGMFWKASVHSWSGNRVQALINLGKYGEDVRKFLRGEAKFPAHMALTVGVTPPPITPTFTMPYRGSATDYHNFLFHIPGINFALAVGNQVGEEMRSACFATHPLHPILLKNLAEMNLNVSKEVAAGARKAQSVLTYVKESKHLQEYLKARGKEMMRGRDAARKMPDVSREE